jgi:hypothetical protein
MKTSGLCWCLLSIACLFVSAGYPVTLRVPADYPTIQEGINAAQSGDTVLVAPMTYTGTNNCALNFLGRQIVVISEAGPSLTIIDCEHLNRGVVFQTGEDSLSVFEGFTIQNGYASGEETGGGILCEGSSPAIRNNIITGCETYWGAGIGCLNARPVIEENTIIENHAERGGGVALLSYSYAVIRGNIIQDNTASGG